MSRRLGRYGALLVVGLLAACAPETNSGTVHHVTLSDPADAGKSSDADADAEEDAEADVYVEPPGPPEIDDMSPLAGPYGTHITITGKHLGSAAREGVTLTLGTDDTREITPGSTPEVVSWTETEIRFRFPFPLSGAVVLTTPEGTAEAGEFEPSWVPGERLDLASGLKVYASIANEPGKISAILDTLPPKLVEFDGTTWSTADVTGGGLRSETLRLYSEDGALAAFALSTNTAPKVIALDPANDFARTDTGLTVSADYVVAGGRQGASVWSRTDNLWTRLRPTAGVWAEDAGPIPDPKPSGSRHVAGTSADGALFVGWGETDSSTFDEWGVAYYQRTPADGSAFLGKTRAGENIDDSISSFSMTGRGAGIVAQYCGTDQDPLGVSSSDVVCYAALLPTSVRRSAKEANGVRYAFDGAIPLAANCSPTYGTRLMSNIGEGKTLASQFDSVPGEIVAWPCLPILTVEVDDEGAPLIIVEHDGALYSPRPRLE